MTSGNGEFTVRGTTARLLKLLVGAPFLGVGGLAMVVGLGRQTTVRTVAFLGIGAVIALVGLLACLSAVQNDEVTYENTGGDGGM